MSRSVWSAVFLSTAIVGCSSAPVAPNMSVSTTHSKQLISSSSVSLASNSQPGQTKSSASIPAEWKEFTETFLDKQVSFRYPQSWKVDGNQGNNMFPFLFSHNYNGKIMHFGMYAGGDVDADSWDFNVVYYGKIKFSRTVWKKEKQITSVSYSPVDTSFGAYDVIKGDIPPKNAQMYLDLYDKIMSSIAIRNM